MFFQIKFYF